MAEKENIFPAVFTRRRVRPVAANAQSEFIGLTDAHDDADGGTTCEQFEKQEITQQAGKGDSSKQCSSYNYNGETERLREYFRFIDSLSLPEEEDEDEEDAKAEASSDFAGDAIPSLPALPEEAGARDVSVDEDDDDTSGQKPHAQLKGDEQGRHSPSQSYECTETVSGSTYAQGDATCETTEFTEAHSGPCTNEEGHESFANAERTSDRQAEKGIGRCYLPESCGEGKSEKQQPTARASRRSSLGLSRRVSLSVVPDEHDPRLDCQDGRRSTLLGGWKNPMLFANRRSTLDRRATQTAFTRHEARGDEDEDNEKPETWPEEVPLEAADSKISYEETQTLWKEDVPEEGEEEAEVALSARAENERQVRDHECEGEHFKRSDVGEEQREEDIPTPLDVLLETCGQLGQAVPTMEEALGDVGLESYAAKKIGEGTFGEAFKAGNSVIKVVPIAGEVTYNGERQKQPDEMQAEVVISSRLSELRKCKENSTEGFIGLNKVQVCRGPYAHPLVEAWESWAEENESENDHPRTLPDDNLFLIFAGEDGGSDLQQAHVASYEQGCCILLQVAYAVAVAERELEFEHRDLHWGNVLLASAEGDHLSFKFGGQLRSVPTRGVKVSLIDFTLSRARTEGQRIFCDLSKEEEEGIFEGPKGYAQSETYRQMREIIGNDWEAHAPRTNALWLGYLARKIIAKLRLPAGSKKRRELERFATRCSRSHQNAHDAALDPALSSCVE